MLLIPLSNHTKNFKDSIYNSPAGAYHERESVESKPGNYLVSLGEELNKIPPPLGVRKVRAEQTTRGGGPV